MRAGTVERADKEDQAQSETALHYCFAYLVVSVPLLLLRFLRLDNRTFLLCGRSVRKIPTGGGSVRRAT